MTDDFQQHLARLRGGSDLFTAGRPILVARAPGRLDVIGGIADYSGSLVLEMPIAEAAFVAVQAAEDRGIIVETLSQQSGEPPRRVTLSSDDWQQLQRDDYDTARRRLHEDPSTSWTAYVLGPALVLLRETTAQLPEGLRVLIDSRVPEGKGVSSSAAVEVATMRALAALANFDGLTGTELARFCQVAENRVVGAPCGIMDQMTSAVGKESELLALRCQPATVEGYAAIPADISFWGIDSGIRHAVSGADYGSVRCGAFMGYRILTDLVGLPVRTADDQPGRVIIDDPRWHGYLANLTPAEFRERFADALPEKMSGAEFLARYHGTTDAVTRVDPARTYAIRQPTFHPIGENARVTRFRELLAGELTGAAREEMGNLMYAAHDSYSACGIGSDGTDLLVQLVREAGPNSGLYGAKITGGGSGGTVAILGRADAGPAVDTIARDYSRRSGRETYIFRDSSPGAWATTVQKVTT